MKRLFRCCLFAALIAGLAIAALTGCGDEREPLEVQPTADVFRVLLTNPHHGQFNVPLTSPIAIHTSHDIEPASIVNRVILANAEGFRPSASVEVNDASIVITPNGDWSARTDYTVTIKPGIKAKSGPALQLEKVVNFQTGLRRPKYGERLTVVRTEPDTDDPCWDFATFRVFFNEPVDRGTLIYGDAVIFTDVETGEVLPGNLFARAGQVVFDPDADLVGGKTYRLEITQTLKDYNDENLIEPFTRDFVAVSTGEHVELAMDICPTAVEGAGFCEAIPDDATYPRSKIVPRLLNSMYTTSVFLGDTDMLIGGRLWNEFGEAALSPDRIPFVVRKGQQMVAKPLEYKVGGEIPSGIHTGEIQITLIADAVGEMLGSEFVHGEAGLPATILLTMDAVMSLEDPRANGLLPQPLLGTQMVGLASVDLSDPETGYEAMKIELTGFTEINLGNERIPVAMAMQMVPPPTLPEKVLDTTPPVIRSVSPVDMVIEPEDITDLVDRRMTGDNVIVYFSEPLDPSNVRDKIHLIGPEGEVDGTYDIYHPKIFFIPSEPLLPNSTYTIVVEPGLTDLLGNEYTDRETFEFSTMPAQSSPTSPPVVLATLPESGDGVTMAKNLVPEFYFSQIPYPGSLLYGETYAMYDLTEGGELVSGTLESYSTFFDWVPDFPLIEGHRYRWTINEGVTNYDGLALDTDMDREPGGPPIVIDFVATGYTKFSETMFMTYPYADADGSGYLDPQERPTKINTMVMDSPLINETSYVMGYFPVNVHELIVGQAGEYRLPAEVVPNAYQIATSIAVDLFKNKDEPELLDMGRMLMQIMKGSRTDIVRGPDGLLANDVNIIMKFNVENSLLNSFLVHDMFLTVPGTLRYSYDGRMMTLMRGTATAGMVIPVIGVMDIPVQVDLLSSTVPNTVAF